jgi:hypothetical protein
VGLAFVVLEEHAGRAVQLRHDHALGAVDDERAGVRHERNLAHVHLLLLQFLDRRLGRLAIHDRQPDFRTQRRGIGEPALLALLHVERRLAEHVRDEVEPRVARVARDRKDRVERGLKALGLAALWRGLGLQESRVAFQLRRQQVRNVEHVRALGKALTDAFLFGKRVGRCGHGCSAVETGFVDKMHKMQTSAAAVAADVCALNAL